MTDLISRQAAIEAIDKIFPADPMRNDYTQGITCGAALAEEYIKQLPSAHPEPCGDVVSRNAIVQKLNEMDRYVSTELRLCDTDKKFPQNEVFIVDDVYEEIVEQLPSAQPEIIRCRDCIAYQEDIDIDGKPFTRCNGINGSVRTYGHTLPDWYCADAERRTDGD